jgi:NAD dependent epimerase/dehydratase family enzyme
MSWIHLDDHCGIIMKGLEDASMQGVYNSVAPNPVTNREFTKEVASILDRPIILPAVPGFALKIILGEMANLVLYGNKISSEKISQAGYTFRFTNLREALIDLLRPKK